MMARLQAAISRKANYIASEPNWFESTHHRVASPVKIWEPEPVPLPLSLAFKEDVFENQDTLPIAELEMAIASRVPDLEESLYIPVEVVKRKESEEDVGVEEEEEPDHDSATFDEIIDTTTARIEELERLIVRKDPHDSGNLDSAYVSGSDFSSELNAEVIFH